METNIIPLLKQVFKEQKEFFFWNNLNLDDLDENCLLKNSITILKNEQIVYYHKFNFLSKEAIESELTYSKSSIYSRIVPILYKDLLEQGYEIFASVFENNIISYKPLTRIGLKDYMKMFSFCIINPFYDFNKSSQPLYNYIEINNGVLGFNGCYLFYETIDILNDYVITTIIKIAKELNIKYIVIFTKYPHLLMNELPYKKTNIIKINTITPQIKQIFKHFSINRIKNATIINNLEFPNSFKRK